ncbi:splicing factor, suppressor of white-apricot homolog [Elysia marginata]|uniref:Splicing factor, suppressor of white-apricot homolog n=1 Tax=Elysia marginata TaxID=1093978 RepID=A0AAV4EK26_9GAST|nr:splicing factor, suppressor of white-apricot homolog [Elysia marginata]
MAASLWWDDGETSQHGVQENKKEDLLVFGYACKLFRDDERANAIDKGKLLIPWMGDEKLMIDRYDGRGHLFDLAHHDADNIRDKGQPTLTEEDEAVEKACDEERYLELHTDVREAEMYEGISNYFQR